MSPRQPFPAPVRAALLLCLPILSSCWAAWGVVMDPKHGTDLHTYQAVGTAIIDGRTFYSATIPGQFWLSPVGAIGGVTLIGIPDPILHLGWAVLCALAVVALIRMAGVRGFALSLLSAIVISVAPGRVAMTAGRLTWFIMLAVVIDLIDWKGRPRWLPRGLLTGLACAIWPFIWPFGAVLLLIRRRAGLIALSTAAAVSLAVAVVLPRMTLVFWTEVVRARFSVRESVLASSNHSILGAALRVIGPEARYPAILLMVVAGVAAIIAAVWWYRQDRPWLAVAMATAAVFVASPIVPNSDLAWILLPVIAATLARRTTPDGLAIVIVFTLAWILADPLQSLPRFVPVADLTLPERLVTAGIPLLALLMTTIGLADARAHARSRGDTEPVVTRFWHHPVTLGIGSLLLGVGAATWLAAIAEADVRAFFAWQPVMADFEVYIRAAKAFVAHEPLYLATDGQWPFLYPPFAAILALPLGIFPRGLVQFTWLAITVAGLMALLWRLGLRGWTVAFATMTCLFLLGPIRSTIGLGQVSVLLMVMCLLDIAPGRGLVATWLTPKRDRLLPAGVLIGIATAIKLTPGLFIPLLWFSGRRRAAIVATITTVAATALGFIVSPRQSVYYWTQVAISGLEFFPDPRGWLHNQSWVSGWQRFAGLGELSTNIAIGIGGVFTIIGLIAAIRWVRRGQVLLGASLCGLAALFVLPVVWNHYYVWALPLGVALLRHGVPRLLRWVGLIATTWLVIEPFWVLKYAGEDPMDFVTWTLAEKLVGITGPVLAMAMAVIALLTPTATTAQDTANNGFDDPVSDHARAGDLA